MTNDELVFAIVMATLLVLPVELMLFGGSDDKKKDE
jgi:hypothetical protein